MIMEGTPRKEYTMNNARSTAASTGIGLGSALAITISWSLYHSIVWCIIHGFFGWLYVVYFALTRAN